MPVQQKKRKSLDEIFATSDEQENADYSSEENQPSSRKSLDDIFSGSSEQPPQEQLTNQKQLTTNNYQKTGNPLFDRMSDPNIDPEKRKAAYGATVAEAQRQKSSLDKFLGGIEKAGNFFDKTLHFGDISNFFAGTAGRVAGDFAGTAVENATKLATHAGIMDKPKDWGFEKDLNELTKSPSAVAKTGANLALELWPGGGGGKSAIKGVASKVGLGPTVEAVARAGGKVSSKVKSILPPVEKVAEFFTNVGKNNFRFIKENPEIYQQVKNFAEDETVVPSFGKKMFDLAKKLTGTASREWQATEAKILQTAERNLKPGVETLQRTVADKLAKEKIVTGAEKALEYTKSAFSQNAGAQGFLNRLQSIIHAPTEAVDDLLTKRTEITSLLDEIPKTERNLKRVVNGVVESFDTALDKITGGQATALRDAYKAKVNPARQIIDAMTDNQGKFSMDRASQYVKTLISDTKFNSKQAVADLQEQLKKAGLSTSDLVKEGEGLGVAKKTAQLAPPTGSRVKDVIMAYGITKIPVFSALTSPKFWAEAIEKTGAKTSLPAIRKMANGFKDEAVKLIMQKVVGNSVKNIVNPQGSNNKNTSSRKTLDEIFNSKI